VDRDLSRGTSHNSKVFFKEFNNASPAGTRYVDGTTNAVEIVIHHSPHIFAHFHRLFFLARVAACEDVLYLYYRHFATPDAIYSA
jgi:heme/copper-type cytochrome/quinol oxidase subunit 1